jgi:hypothetical protein
LAASHFSSIATADEIVTHQVQRDGMSVLAMTADNSYVERAKD